MNKKRILSALLAVMMVFTILPVNVFATSPSDVKPANVAHEVVTNGELVTDGTDKTGKVEIQKTAKALAGANEFQLTLTAKGSSVTTQIPGADIVMVLDKSGSMGESGMASLKAAATTFLTTVLATGNDNRVSIVNYDTLPKSATAWYTSTEADLARAISKIATESNGGTNTQGGLYLARQQLATSQAANKIIVLLSDGDPTYNVPTNLSGYTRDTTAKLEDYGTKVQFDYDEATSKKEGAGHKTTYTKEFRYNRRDKDITLNSGYAAIYESGLAKSVNTSVYSIGFKTNSTTLGILDSIASPATETTQYCYDAPDEATLKRVFGEIGQAIKDNTVGSGVSDILSADATKVAVQLDGSFKKATNANLTDGNYYANNGEVTYKEGTLSWSPTDVVKDAGAMLTYRVKMNVETANYDPSVVTPTNGVTTFGYKDYKETEKIAEFDVPTVKTVHGTIQRVGVLCDVNGNYLNAEGEIVTDPAAAQQLVLPEYVDNAVGKPYWNPDHTGITVNAPAAPANYVAYGNKTSETVDLVYSNDAATYNKIAYFPFYLNETSVTVTKLWNDENNAYGTRPTSIAVTIEGKSSDDSVTLNRTLTGDATASRWSASFDQLPLTDAHGHSYVYTVKSEAAVTGYTPTIAGTTVTNSLDGKTLTLNKVNETGEALPGASFTIKDLKTGKTSTETEQSFAIELAYGHIYEITENAPTGYTANAPFYVRAMQKVELVKQDGTVLSALTNVVLNGLTMKVTNVHKIDVSGTKTWADDKNEFHTRPESITLVLKQNGTALSVQPSWTKDNENNTWSYTFAGLDKQDATGKDYRYTVEESPVSGYQATVKGMDITNTLETAAIHFAKRNDSGEVMQGVSFTLSGNGTTRTELSNDKGNVSFTGIPAGTYTLTETTPTGFVTKAVQTIVVAKNANGVLTVTMDGKPLNKVENIANTATVSLVKVGSDNENAVLSGATFEVKDDLGNIIQATNGVYTVKYGRTYTFTETAAPAGYDKLTDAFTVTYVSASEVKVLCNNAADNGKVVFGDNKLTIKVIDPQILGSITLTKQGAESKPLAGVTFDIYRNETQPTLTNGAWSGVKVGNVTTDDKGTATINNLPVGSYWAVETSAPAEYELQAEAIALGTITAANRALTPAAITDKLVERSIKIIKTGKNDVKLAGAEFDIYRSETEPTLKNGAWSGTKVNTAPVVTDADGEATIRGLGTGTYWAVETKAPTGYQLLGAAKLLGSIDRNAAELTQQTISNGKLTATVTLNKLDQSGALLPGANFSLKTAAAGAPTLTKATEQETATWTFTAEHGTEYTITETDVPNGYNGIASSFTVQLADDGNAVIISTVDGVAASGLTVNVTNTQILGSVGIAKTGANGAALADVTFEVYRSAEKPVYTAATKTWSGDLVGEMTTDRQGNATLGGLTIGNYWAIETAAPGAYELIAEPIALGAITKDGALESVPVSNTQIDGSITVNKVDENGKALAGATFALYRVEGRSTNFFTNLVNTVKNVFDSKAVSGARFVSEKTTGADGVAKFEHLAPGRYYVVETAAPEGYALNSTPSAVMNVMRGGGKQNNHTLTVENSKITQLLTFNKVDAAGNLRNGAEFVILSAKNADGSKATTPTLTTVDGNTWSFTAVHGVTYTLHESKTPAGYETIQDFTLKLETVNGKTAVAASAGIAAVGTTGFEFNVANAKQMTSVTVEKVWVNGGKTENSATIVLERAIAGGTKVDVETAALSKSTAWKHTFANLDKTDDDGNVYTYTVREEKAGPDYQVVITGNMNNGFVVTNTLKADTTIKLAKVWNDAAAVSARPESVTLIISGTKADGTSEELTRATLTTENTENWTVAREVAVAKYDASGAAYTGYSITELASTGYEVAVVANGSDYTVTNTLSATTSVKIAKIWLDEETTHGDVTVQLYRAITGEAEKAVGEPVTFAKDHEWKDLAKYDASGAEYTYTVKETSTHAGYEVLPVAGGLENGIYKYTITNRKTGTTALTIQKNWNDDATKDTARQDVTFTLQRKVVGDAAATTCGTLKVTAPSWTATAENLPKYNENGKLYTYSIVEQTIGGYESKIAAPVEKDGTLFFEVTNTRRGTHTIQGEKVWRDGNSAARPTSVTITLERYTLSDGKMVKDVAFGTKESVASAANGWKYSFNDVESFDANGKSYNYVLNETGLSNSEYKMTLEQLNNTVDIVNINVVNTLTGTVSVEIVKDWHDATDKDRPENVTMTLTRKTSVGADASFSEKFTLNTANSWGKTFDALAKYDAEGRLYEYAVSEDAVAGYEEDSSKGAVNIKDNKVTIHVANVRKDDTGRLVATKIWKDADNQQGLRPTSITINLIRTDSDNNETQISKTVTAADNWTAVFENVDLYDSDGKLYTNVFTEEAVPGYATDYLVKDEGLKVEITNTLSAKANVVATKTWLDAGDESMRPEALPLTLYRQTGTSEKTVVTTEPTITKTGSNWSYNYGELAQYDTEGRPYVYSVEETVPAGYTLDTARSSVLHLYNVRTELTNVTATKAWQDSDNADGIRPQSVELSLERGIAPQAMTPLADTKVTVTAQANWQHTYENLPKFDENGNLYLYNVKEETLVPHYDEVAKAAPSTTATNQIRNKHLVTVRYVDLGTETKLMGDVVLGSFYEGQDYSAATQAAQPIQTYTNLGVRTTGAGSAPINGTMGTEDLLIVIEYSKIRTIPLTVKYMEVTLKDDGSFDRAAAIPMVGVNDVTTYFAEGESYDANRNPGLTYGYSFVKSEDASVAGSEVLDPTNLTGTMSPEKPLTFIHYFVRKLGENVIMHSYNHIHHPLTGNDVVNAEGQNSNPLNAGGTISIASLLVTVNGNYSYNPTSAEVLRLKNPQTNDELAALIATTIGDRVSEATKTEKADLDAKMLAVQTAADAQIAAQSAYDAAKLAYDTALATLVAQDPAVVAATQELAKANALIVGVPEADKMALVAAAEATLKSAQDALANAAEDVDHGPLQAAVDAASQALADAAALVIGDATAEVKAAAILAAQTALDSATAAATTTAVANLAAEQAALTAAEQALDAAKTAKVTAENDAAAANTVYTTAANTVKALYAVGTPEYDAIVAACTETGSSVWENVYNGDISGNFTMDEHYTYVVKLLYQRETIEKPLPTPTPVPTPTPTPAPIPPPVVPPIVPIPDEKVPLGPVPSNKPVKKKGTYSIKDEDVPLGALPHTSGSRGAAAGSVGALLLVAGTVLHLFKKKEDEE